MKDAQTTLFEIALALSCGALTPPYRRCTPFALMLKVLQKLHVFASSPRRFVVKGHTLTTPSFAPADNLKKIVLAQVMIQRLKLLLL